MSGCTETAAVSFDVNNDIFEINENDTEESAGELSSADSFEESLEADKNEISGVSERFLDFLNKKDNDVENKPYYNLGHRGDIATKLSDAAVMYYDGCPDIMPEDELSGEALKETLCYLMQDTLVNKVTYNDLGKYMKYTDAEDGKKNIRLFYSNESVNLKEFYFNREHVWPKSHASFYEINGGADLHHLRPANEDVNSFRSSYMVGDIDEKNPDDVIKIDGMPAGYIKDATFEPIDCVKGDMARILLYVYCTWSQPNLFDNVLENNLPVFDEDDSSNDGLKVIESPATLLQWCYDDPVGR